jgi:hypothetical protein
MNQNEPNRIFLAAIDEIEPNRIHLSPTGWPSDPLERLDLLKELYLHKTRKFIATSLARVEFPLDITIKPSFMAAMKLRLKRDEARAKAIKQKGYLTAFYK